MPSAKITICVPTIGRPYLTEGKTLEALQKIVGGRICPMDSPKGVHPTFVEAHASWATLDKIFKNANTKKMRIKIYGNDNGVSICAQNPAVFSLTEVDADGGRTWGNLVIQMTQKASEKVPEIASLPFYKTAEQMETVLEEEEEEVATECQLGNSASCGCPSCDEKYKSEDEEEVEVETRTPEHLEDLKTLQRYRDAMDKMMEILKDTKTPFENEYDGENRFHGIDDLENLALDYKKNKELMRSLSGLINAFPIGLWESC